MKNNKNILLAVIGGIVACVVCAGIVFLYPKNETNLKGNDNDNEINLGDEAGCSSHGNIYGGGNWVCGVGNGENTYNGNSTNNNYECAMNHGLPNCTSGCYQQRVVTGQYCSSCYSKYYKSGDTCVKCPANSYCEGGTNQPVSCPSGYNSELGGAASQSDCFAIVNAGEGFTFTGQTYQKYSCAKGSYAAETRHVPYGQSSSCTLCEKGYYQDVEGQSSCKKCPNGTTTASTGANSADKCVATATPTATASQCRKTGTSAYCENINCAAMSESNCKSNTTCCTWGSGGGTVTPTAVSCLSGEYYDGTACRSCSGNTNGAYPNSAAGSSGITSCYAELDGTHEVVVAYAQASSCASGYVQTGRKVNYGSTLRCTDCTSQGKVPDPTNHQCVVASTATTTPTATATTKPTATATTQPTSTATPKPCANITGSTSCLARSDCEFDYTNGCHNKPQTCTTPNTYWNGTSCISCPNGFRATATIPTCHMTIPAGSYYNPAAGSTVISSCPAGTYSSGGTYYASGNNSSSLTNCTSCPSGTTSPIGSKSKSACVAPSGECTLTVTSSATTVSPSTDKCPSDNRYPDTWTVTVKVTGDGCTGATLTMGGTGAERSGSSGDHKVTNGQTFNFLYRATTCCSTATATATLTKDGKTIASGSKTVTTSSGWKLSTTDQCVTTSEYNSNPHSEKEADDQGKDVYYIAKNNSNPDCVGNRVVDIYRRGCGGGGGTTYSYCCAKNDGSSYVWYSGQRTRSCPAEYTLDSTKNVNTCKTVPVPACYVDSEEGYHWTNDPEDSWVKVVGVTKETDCKKEETPACYKDPNGNYTWGKFARIENYTLITSINNEELCHNPETGEACYKNVYDDYQWTSEVPKECINKNSCWVPRSNQETGGTCKYTTQNACEDVEGYKVVTSATKPEECTPPENPACYLHGQEFVWGKYENVTGYIKLDDIDAEIYCKLPPEEACYKDPDGGYVWGEYSNDDGYKLIPSITNIEQCNNDVPTPATGLDVSKIIYISMAILMAFGIGFIYYSSVMKKETINK